MNLKIGSTLAPLLTPVFRLTVEKEISTFVHNRSVYFEHIYIIHTLAGKTLVTWDD